MNVGVVVIGRNEGERLRECLASVCPSAEDVVYVDSGSTDHSLLIAREMGVHIHELDESVPFSAARARNEGFAYLYKQNPTIQFVQFIDGDCTLSDSWLEKASNELALHADYAAVVGHLQELHPEDSIYNHLCAMEWRMSAVGDITDSAGLGGISMISANVFNQLKGFNPNLVAGEEPELAVRMALANYKVVKIDYQMAVHDADMHHFSQWWKRTIRGGHAIAHRAFLNGSSAARDCVRERSSIWLWGIGLPLLVLFTIMPSSGWSALLLAGYPVLGFRVFRYRRKLGDIPYDAILYASFIVIGKFAEGIGLLKFHQNRLQQRYEIIEYK